MHCQVACLRARLVTIGREIVASIAVLMLALVVAHVSWSSVGKQYSFFSLICFDI
jgi:hypothetical protein